MVRKVEAVERGEIGSFRTVGHCKEYDFYIEGDGKLLDYFEHRRNMISFVSKGITLTSFIQSLSVNWEYQHFLEEVRKGDSQVSPQTY